MLSAYKGPYNTSAPPVGAPIIAIHTGVPPYQSANPKHLTGLESELDADNGPGTGAQWIGEGEPLCEVRYLLLKSNSNNKKMTKGNQKTYNSHKEM